jgi:tetratricopeptide (TPR) repeat protein
MNRHERRANSKAQRTSNGPYPQTAAGAIPRGTAELLQCGVKHHQAGHAAEAEACYRRVLAAQPNHADALHLLGIIAHQTGRNDLAVELIRLAIKQSGQALYFFSLGTALKAQSQFDEAITAYRHAIRIKSDYAEAHFSVGNVMIEQRRLNEAAAAYRHAIRIKPDYAQAHFNLGNVLRELLRLDEAAAAYRHAIRIKPDYAEAYCNLGTALRQAGKTDEAIAAYQQSIAIIPQYADAHCNLSGVFFDQGKLDEAIVACRQAITLKPHLPEGHDNLGMALMQLGRMAEARIALEEAVRLAPGNAKYLGDLGQITHFVPGDPHLAKMERLARNSASLTIDDRIALHFALGKAYDETGRHAEAFHQWLEGNALKRQQITYNEAATLEVLDRVQSVFTSELIRRWQKIGHPSSVPVFIVGMPRSGTTLIEQILASHPRVFGGGELTHFRRAVKEMRQMPGGSTTFPELVSGMTGEYYRDLGARYVAEIERLAPGATHITDKLPNNFIYAGLIHLVLPNAVIVHVTRNPIDTCLSCFSKLFAYELNHTYDLGELGRYYQHYKSLMAHWHHVLPHGRILDVSYEDVVADLEGQARRIIAHCGLNWDSRCLAFHKTERPVRTASAMQVRQPIYNSAIGRGCVYTEFLAPLLTELDLVGNELNETLKQ